jgi:hypothetical protein
MKKTILIIAIVLLHFSCANTKNSMAGSVGFSQSKLIKVWGTPVRTLSNNQEGEILVYADQVFLDSDSDGFKMAGQNYWNYNYIYVNKEGKVTSIRQEKQSYPPQAIDSQKVLGMNLLTGR